MDTPAWIGPTIAISLVIIAASFLVMGAVALTIGLGIRKVNRDARAKLTALTADARAATARLRSELDGYADLATETRLKLTHGVAKVEQRLQDVDALVEVLQEEAEEAALDVAALVRTVRRTGGILGSARRMLRKRRRRD